MACLFGRNLTHLHRVGPGDDDHDINGEFWKRHRALDNVLLSTSLSLPDNLRLPAGVGDANVVFLNMNIHTSTICLHQAAIFKADKSRIPAQYITDCKRRCMVSADQITSIMKMISHTDLSAVGASWQREMINCLTIPANFYSIVESVYCFLSLCSLSGVHTAPQVASERRVSFVITSFLIVGNECFQG